QILRIMDRRAKYLGLYSNSDAVSSTLASVLACMKLLLNTVAGPAATPAAAQGRTSWLTPSLDQLQARHPFERNVLGCWVDVVQHFGGSCFDLREGGLLGAV